MSDVLPTPESPRMMTLRRTFLREAMVGYSKVVRPDVDASLTGLGLGGKSMMKKRPMRRLWVPGPSLSKGQLGDDGGDALPPELRSTQVR